jgi:hypothetical protein
MIVLLAALALSNSLTCGTERWAQKTLTDSEAPKINYETTETTISGLNKLTAPSTKRKHRTPVELQVWSVKGSLDLVKTEADGDYHVVVADSSGMTIIVEIPDPKCTTSKKLLSTLAATRDSIQTIPLHSMVEVSGVAFFDFAHRQTGHALNYIELHPVLTLARVPHG